MKIQEAFENITVGVSLNSQSILIAFGFISRYWYKYISWIYNNKTFLYWFCFVSK